MSSTRLVLCTALLLLLSAVAIFWVVQSENDPQGESSKWSTVLSTAVASDESDHAAEKPDQDRKAQNDAGVPIREGAAERDVTSRDGSESAAAGQVQTATFGSGCFWCGEAVFEQLAGVISAESGYAGGHVDNPTYYQVARGNTGHAEVVQIRYDPAVISYVELLEVFWRTHDPTTLNRQGVDRGPHYRSIILYHDEDQQRLAEELKQKLESAGAYRDPIVTEIAAYEKFYPAEDYHQDYYANNKQDRYCRVTIVPKLEKLKKVFADKLKEQE